MIDKNHPLVGRAVVYRGTHPGAKPEQGTVTSVNVSAGIVFVRYGTSTTSAATSARHLTSLDGSPVDLSEDGDAA